MRNRISLLLVVLLGYLSCLPVLAGGRAEVFYSDIRAYIDETPIRSYNIEGWTGVVAEDLREYGFTVEWLSEERALYIHKSGEQPITASYQFSDSKVPSGAHAAYIYETDIKTYVAGEEATAYNIGGYTIVLIDSLQPYGDVVWNPVKREISFTYRAPWAIALQASQTGITHLNDGPRFENPISDVFGHFQRTEHDFTAVQQHNLEHLSWVNLGFDKKYGGLQLGFSMTAHHLYADFDFYELCRSMCTISYDNTPLQESAELANQHMRIWLNGELASIKDVRMGRGNNHIDFYFILDADIEKQDVFDIRFECSL